MWGCEKDDKVKHFFTFTDAESFPACEPDNSRMRELTKGGSKPKCKECVSVKTDE